MTSVARIPCVPPLAEGKLDMSENRGAAIEAGLALGADGVVRLTWPRDAVITGPDAERAMLRVNELCGDDRHPMLVDMATTADVTRAARAVFGRPCQASRIALLGASPVDRVLANFFLGINTVPCPTKFFTSESAALSWLALT